MAEKNSAENTAQNPHEAISLYVAKQLSVDVSEVTVEGV